MADVRDEVRIQQIVCVVSRRIRLSFYRLIGRHDASSMFPCDHCTSNDWDNPGMCGWLWSCPYLANAIYANAESDLQVGQAPEITLSLHLVLLPRARTVRQACKLLPTISRIAAYRGVLIQCKN